MVLKLLLILLHLLLRILGAAIAALHETAGLWLWSAL